ncbi:MAG: metalloregulator ArsR/SmtB family transcription factor [Pseudomonadota bacterium]
MPSRNLVAKELAELFKIVAHPDRIRLIEELRASQKDVNSLADALDLPASRVSQHLSLMRAHRFVEDEREGRKHIYKLVQPEIADWIVEGLDFIEGRMRGLSPRDIKSARALWTGGDPASTPPTTDVNS